MAISKRHTDRPSRPHGRGRLIPGSDERGTALVEFALVAPLFMVLLFGMLHFGRAFNYWIDETHLANQGARWAAVDRNPGDGSGLSLQDYIKSQGDTEELRDGQPSAGIAGPDGMDVYICFPDGSSNVGDPVRVIVSTTWNWASFVPLVSTLGSSFSSVTTTDIRTQATMRLEQSPTTFTEDGPCP